MDPTMIERVHKYIAKFEQKTHAKIGFGEAVRALLDRALDREGIQ